MNLDDSERVVGKQEVIGYFLFARHSGAIRWVSSKLDWIVSFSSLIVCAQCVSRDWLAVEKDCLYRVIR
jgi:hypothetical protein